MTKVEALKLMVEGWTCSNGSKLYRINRNGDFIEKAPNAIYFSKVDFNELPFYEWERYSEPKKTKKVKYAPVVFKDNYGNISVSLRYYKEEEKENEAFTKMGTLIKWLEDSELAVEVEVEE